MTTSGSQPSGWAIGGVVFAATMMIMVGIFQAFQGLAAILNDEFFVRVGDYAFNVDVTTWGWIHLILGIVVAAAGFYLFSGSALGRGRRRHPRLVERPVELLLHPLLPVLVDPDDRPQHLRDLGGHPAGGAPGLTPVTPSETG